MKTNKNIIVALIFGASSIFASEAKIAAKVASSIDQSVKKSALNLTVESNSDIYGVQFDIKYNAQELNLTEGDIKSKVPGVNIYSRIKEDGIARVLMFGMNGEKILDVNANNIGDILDINFQSADMFNGVSQVELIDVILAGKGGEEVSVSRSTAFEVSLNTTLNLYKPALWLNNWSMRRSGRTLPSNLVCASSPAKGGGPNLCIKTPISTSMKHPS